MMLVQTVGHLTVWQYTPMNTLIVSYVTNGQPAMAPLPPPITTVE